MSGLPMRLTWLRPFAACCCIAGCGGSTPEPETVSDAQRGTGFSVEGKDGSRCNYLGRKDRASLVFKGPAAAYPTIRRVYAVSSKQHEGRILRCREVDSNLDGKKDLFRSYNARGVPLLEMADTDYNGKIDTWVVFAAGRVSELRVDTNRDGEPDEFRSYTDGVVVRIQRDSDLDGKVDTWEVYEDGRLSRLGVDLDGDGQVDRWHRDAELEQQRLMAEEAREKAESTQAGTTAPPASTSTADSGETAGAASSAASPPPTTASSVAPPPPAPKPSP